MKKYMLIFTSIIMSCLSVFTIFAVTNFSPKLYSIQYDLDGGINHENNLDTLEFNSSLTLSPASKNGFIFKGWYDSETNGNQILKIDNNNIKDLTLYARWEMDENSYGTLPLIEINTQNNQLPYNKTDYINCSFKISNCEDEESNFSIDIAPAFDEKEEPNNVNSVGIRLRGNSTMGAPKQPYRIKFEKKKSLLNMTSNKSWVLLADYYDQSAIRNYSAFSMSSIFNNLDFTPTPNHVVLFINNEYKGLYLLTEQIDEKSGRTDCEEDINSETDVDFPFLIEMDRNALSEGITGIDNSPIEGFYPIEIKYPELKDRNLTSTEDPVFDYIVEYINAVTTTLKTNAAVEVSFRDTPVMFEDLVNVDSFIDYYLLTELMHNQDSTWGSIYMHKTKDGKLMMGPVWDFDWSLSNEYIIPYDRSYIEQADDLIIAKLSKLFNNYLKVDGNFNKVCNRWNVVSSQFNNYINNLKIYIENIKPVARYDASVWYGSSGIFQFDMQADYVRLFLIDRIDFFDTLFNETHSQFLERLV